jgi:hypothetical protein
VTLCRGAAQHCLDKVSGVSAAWVRAADFCRPDSAGDHRQAWHWWAHRPCHRRRTLSSRSSRFVVIATRCRPWFPLTKPQTNVASSPRRWMPRSRKAFLGQFSVKINTPQARGSLLNADNPQNGVLIPRRFTAENANDELRSITQCRSLLGPPAKARERSKHGSLLSEKFRP